MGRIRRFIDRTYAPRPAKWKRPVLFALSAAMLILAIAGGWAQITYQWTAELWLAVAAFGILGVIGILVSLFGSDYWVAVTLGRPDF